ncbi:aldo/keto reductase family oxidoreductase [Flavobacterium sp.]|jgi:predicted oxidoreductase|uniref:aldo/keto reductase family oxidoreductase n=1 Tax=Flavobacterium sp. TaxID=239 RepID=UPI0037BEDCCE
MNSRFSRIIAGTMNWGSWDKKLSTSEMANTIHVCVENNITTFDHAAIYGDYTTETDFGKGFKSSGIAREKVQLISKCGMIKPAANSTQVKQYESSKESMIKSVDTSLKNLQTDYLDALLIHRPNPLMQADEVAEAVTQLKKEGKILDFGVSNFTTSQTELLRSKIEMNYNQIQFSATHFNPMVDGSLDYMQIHNIQPMAWNPLGTVFREDTKQTRDLKKLLSRLVEKYEVGSDMILLAWILKHPANIIPLAGTVNTGRLQNIHKATEMVLEQEDWFAIWSESMGHRIA